MSANLVLLVELGVPCGAGDVLSLGAGPQSVGISALSFCSTFPSHPFFVDGGTRRLYQRLFRYSQSSQDRKIKFILTRCVFISRLNFLLLPYTRITL